MGFFSVIKKVIKREEGEIHKDYKFVNLAHQDPLFAEAGQFIVSKNTASIGLLQRYFKIGFNRASNIIDQLESANIIGKKSGTQPRAVLMNIDELEWYLSKCQNNPNIKPETNETENEIEVSNSVDNNVVNIDAFSGEEFEKFCCWMLHGLKYTDIQLTNTTGDKGIDIIAVKDDIKYAIQCKCYAGNIGNSAIQEAFSGKSIYNADVAVVLTNSYFTKQAIEDAQMLRVRLWDRTKLYEFLQQIVNASQ